MAPTANSNGNGVSATGDPLARLREREVLRCHSNRFGGLLWYFTEEEQPSAQLEKAKAELEAEDFFGHRWFFCPTCMASVPDSVVGGET